MNQNVIASYPDPTRDDSLPAVCRDLFARQVRAWPELGKAQASLQSARRREIPDGEFSFTLQFNPGRIGSIEARTDAASIAQRPCFLCDENRPTEQETVLYRRRYGVLCNPFPIFTPHFTIARLEHLPQTIEANIGDFLELARDFSPEFSVFYNGPRCGASAPDHLHFQACPSGDIPIEREGRKEKGALIINADGFSLTVFSQGSRQFFLMESGDGSALVSALSGVMQILKRLAGTREEAMVNIVASFGNGQWRLYIFPRRKHRPAAFFRAGGERRAITPGAVEIGGLVITANERDFLALDKHELREIFTEVSADGEMIRACADELRRSHR